MTAAASVGTSGWVRSRRATTPEPTGGCVERLPARGEVGVRRCGRSRDRRGDVCGHYRRDAKSAVHMPWRRATPMRRKLPCSRIARCGGESIHMLHDRPRDRGASLVCHASVSPTEPRADVAADAHVERRAVARGVAKKLRRAMSVEWASAERFSERAAYTGGRPWAARKLLMWRIAARSARSRRTAAPAGSSVVKRTNESTANRNGVRVMAGLIGRSPCGRSGGFSRPGRGWVPSSAGGAALRRGPSRPGHPSVTRSGLSHNEQFVACA